LNTLGDSPPSSQALDAAAVRGLLPHRPPFLFVDRAEIEPKSGWSRTWYLFQAKDPFFEGHFPGYPLVPGVVILECMAQASRLLLNARAGGLRPGFLVGVDGAKFNHKVHPGDLLRVETRLTRATGDGAMDGEGAIHSFGCAAYLDITRCARAQINLYQAPARRTTTTSSTEPEFGGMASSDL
jgi:3-hydroxyacyl-[acyl-carrier-protein] dehydratase